jgi:phosphate:Na+ symporter
MGANIGTTITAQLVAFKINYYALLILLIGFLLLFLSKKRTNKYIGEMLLGLGILFVGMNFMIEGVKPLKQAPFFTDLLTNFSQIPILGILAGALFTGIIQSSSATSGLAIAMGMGGIINLKAAICLILGANIGTCITALLASIGASLQAKRAAITHLLFNIIGVAIFFLFLPFFVQIMSQTSTNLARQIAHSHTIFNVSTTLILLPFIALLVNVVKKIIPGEEIKIDRGIKYLDKRVLDLPSLALSQAAKETHRMACMTYELLSNSYKVLILEDIKFFQPVIKQEEVIDDLHRKIRSYLIKLSEKPLTKKESQKLAALMHSISDIERIGDHGNNIAELGEIKIKKKIPFSEEAQKELEEMFSEVKNMYGNVVKILNRKNIKLATCILDQEGKVDQLERKLRNHHLKRLKAGICNPQAGIIFIDIIRNLERIGDHSDSIAHVRLTGF